METVSIISLLSIIVALCGYIIFHHLTLKREKISRLAESSNIFRNSVLKSVSHIPKANDHWDNKTLKSMPNVVIELELAVELFKVFLSKTNKENFEKEWSYLKKHIENQIPKSLSTAKVMYDGGAPLAKEAKEKFHEQLQKILNYAKET